MQDYTLGLRETLRCMRCNVKLININNLTSILLEGSISRTRTPAEFTSTKNRQHPSRIISAGPAGAISASESQVYAG